MPSTGTPASNTSIGARGEPASGTLAGPPDRMIARGLKPRMRPGSALNGQISQ
jgi:hypothetical protein